MCGEQLYCMDDFNVSDLKFQQVILVVASTFGEGEAPSNGKNFKDNLDKLHRENSTIRNANRIPL